MKNFIFQFANLIFIVVAMILFAPAVAAQTETIEPEIKSYVDRVGKKAKVPAEINKIVRGDLNGDGKEDAAIQYYVQVGFPGNLTAIYLTAFVNKNGKMTRPAEVLSNVLPVEIRNGEIVCDKFGESGKQKFEKIGTIKYKLVKKKLVEVKAGK